MKTIILKDNAILENEIYDGIDLDFTHSDVLIRVVGDNVVIRKCKLENFTKDMKRIISVTGKNCLIDNCVFNQLSGNGPVIVLERKSRVNTPDDLVIKNCLFYNIDKPLKNGDEIIRLGYSKTSLTESSNNVIFNNRFENCNIETINIKCCSNLIVKNTFINCKSTLTLRHGNNTIVANNIFDGKNNTECGGIRVSGEHHLIISNTFINILGNGGTKVCISLNNGLIDNKLNGYFPVKQCSILNNIFSKCKAAFAIGYIVKNTNITPSDIIIQGNTFNTIDEIFSSHKEVIGVRNGVAKNNTFMFSNIGKNLGFNNAEFRYTHILTNNIIEIKEFTNYTEYREYLLSPKYDPQKNPQKKPQNEDTKSNYENNILNNIAKHYHLQIKMARFNEIKSLIQQNQAELNILMKEMSFIFKNRSG